MAADIPTHSVLYTLEQAIKAYRKLCQQNLDRVQDDFTVDQALVLMALAKYPVLSQQQIAELVFKDKASLTRIIELLVQKGMLTRAIHSTDRRKFNLQITPQGQHALAHLGDTILLNQQTALAGVTEDELAQFSGTLQKIIANCTAPKPCD